MILNVLDGEYKKGCAFLSLFSLFLSFFLFACICSYKPHCPSLVPQCLPLLWLWGWIATVCMIVSKPRDSSGNLRFIFLHLWTGADYYQLDPGLSVCTILPISSRKGFHMDISLHFWFEYHKHLFWVLVTLEKTKADLASTDHRGLR